MEQELCQKTGDLLRIQKNLGEYKREGATLKVIEIKKMSLLYDKNPGIEIRTKLFRDSFNLNNPD